MGQAKIACAIGGLLVGCALLLTGCGSSEPPTPINCGLSNVKPVCGSTLFGVGLSVDYSSFFGGISIDTAVSKLRDIGVRSVRLWNYDESALQTLSKYGINDVFITVPNAKLKELAYPSSFSNLAENIAGTVQSFMAKGMKFTIGVGNEPTAPFEKGRFDRDLKPALQKMHDVLVEKGLDKQVPLSVVFDLSILDRSYPPLAGAFKRYPTIIKDVAKNLYEWGGVFSVNVYPWFTLKDAPVNLCLGIDDSVVDGVTYHGVLHQQIRAVRAALVRLNPDYKALPLVIAESGWPSDGAPHASVENECIYLTKLLTTVHGTDEHLQAIYYFSGVDEAGKSSSGHGGAFADVEDHFGLFYEGGTPKFHNLSFACEESSSAQSHHASNEKDKGADVVSLMTSV